MISINLGDAKARLSELVHQVETGDTVRILRRGKEVAQLTSVARPKKAVNRAMLRAVTANMPPQPDEAGTFVRNMRDDDRY